MIDKYSLLRSRLADFVQKSYTETNFLKFTDFLDEFECSTVIDYFKSIYFENYILFGGYEEATRKILAVYSSDVPEKNPISLLKLDFSNIEYLGHRNILGALMNLNISRSLIGDICISEKVAFVFCLPSAETIIKNELEYVGKSRVVVSETDNFKDYKPETKIETYSISSERLDCIVSAVVNSSRSKAEELINSSLVFVNGSIEKNTAKKIKENSKISVRGFGKFQILDMSERTRRDRIRLKILKFI